MMSSCRDPRRGSFWTYSETRTTNNLPATSRLLKERALQSSTSNQMLVSVLWILAAFLVLSKLYNTHSGLVSGHVYISLGLVKESFIKRNPSDFLDLRLDCLRLPFLLHPSTTPHHNPCKNRISLFPGDQKGENASHIFFFFCKWQMLLGSSNQEISSQPKMF